MVIDYKNTYPIHLFNIGTVVFSNVDLKMSWRDISLKNLLCLPYFE